MQPIYLTKLARKNLDTYLIGVGLGAEIARYFKKTGDDPENGTVTHKQIEMWTNECRTMILDINRARVYVPSRKEYVDLEPGSITQDQALEAGEYLKTKGEDCIRVGTQLIELSKLKW